MSANNSVVAEKSETKSETSLSPDTDDYSARKEFNDYYINYIDDLSGDMENIKTRVDIQQSPCQLEVSQLTDEVV